MRYGILDKQLHAFAARLTSAVGLHAQETSKVATAIAAEVRFLESASRAQILSASPVPLRDRLDELTAFQAWMDLSTAICGSATGSLDTATRAAFTRAQVIAQNYVCFVYLGEPCFIALKKTSKLGSVTRRCCKYLTDNPVRAFRNAISHSNWTYKPDFCGLVFWARKGSDPNEALSRFEVSQEELDFWQMLSRSVAYAAYTSIEASETQSHPLDTLH